MVEARVVAESKGRVDTWHDGRFLERWAPPDVLVRLPVTFACFDREDVARALDETGRLFSEEARRVSRESGFTYPADVESSVVAQASEILRSTRSDR